MLRHHRRTAVSSECCRYRLVTGTRRSDHISPVMIRQLHWLPVRRHRVVFNIATLVYRSLSGNSAGYLSARRRRPCQTTAFCRHSNTCCQSDMRRFGDRTFAAAGPQVWNSLSPYLRLCWLSHGQFRRLLKTFLFGQ